MQGCQLPMSLNIENWQARDDTWRHNPRIMTSFVQKILVDSDCHEFAMIQNARKPIRLLYYNDILELMRKHSMLTLKWHKQHKIVEILLLERWVYWRNGILRCQIILEISFMASPELSGRVDSTVSLSVYCWTISQSFLGVVSNLLKLLHWS